MQVCPVELRLITAPHGLALACTWQPPGGAANVLASAWGETVAVCTQTTVFSLQCDCGWAGGMGWRFVVVSTAQLDHPVSSLNVVPSMGRMGTFGGSGGGAAQGKGEGGAWVLLGQWVANRLTIVAATDLGHTLLVVDLGRLTARWGKGVHT